MNTPVLLMYLLSVVIGVTSYLVSRGPDGKLVHFFWAFGAIAVAYVALAWLTRHQPIWLHLAAHVVLFGAATALGMLPKPHLEEMAGMLYMFAAAVIVGMFILACVARLLGRWV
jgi:hypothetical protein